MPLSEIYIDRINSIKVKTSQLFCTNAYRFVFDKNNKEIYGILQLVDFFNQSPNIGLIISDPSGTYMEYIKKAGIELRENIALLIGDHPFFEVLRKSNCFIRNSSTDGDSISIREALYLGVNVIATNCVDRPRGVKTMIYGDELSLRKLIYNNKSIKPSNNNPINGGLQLLNIYRNQELH
jgi:hypothetical protein